MGGCLVGGKPEEENNSRHAEEVAGQFVAVHSEVSFAPSGALPSMFLTLHTVRHTVNSPEALPCRFLQTGLFSSLS